MARNRKQMRINAGKPEPKPAMATRLDTQASKNKAITDLTVRTFSEKKPFKFKGRDKQRVKCGHEMTSVKADQARDKQLAKHGVYEMETPEVTKRTRRVKHQPEVLLYSTLHNSDGRDTGIEVAWK